MSNFSCPVITVGPVRKHENADTLDITKVGDFPVVVRRGEIKEGDKCVYIPIDSIVPSSDPRFAWLGKHTRIRAARLRGVFSMGLLIPADNDMCVGDDVAQRLGITKWEPPEPPTIMGGETIKHPSWMLFYTDIDHLRKYPDVLKEGEEVVITEKIHGCNSRFAYRDGQLWVGSHKTMKKMDENNLWWKIAKEYDLENKLKNYPDLILFGEVYGSVQDLSYGVEKGKNKFVAFDIFDFNAGGYLSYEKFESITTTLDVPIAPVLYRGPWKNELKGVYGGGKSTLGDNISEGFVVRPVIERYDEKCGRVVLKYISEDYLCRKGGTEFH